MRAELSILTALAACGSDLTSTTTLAATACGVGTHLEGATCVVAPTQFMVHVPRSLGRPSRRNRILVTATADGAPVVDDIVLSLDPPIAGSLSTTESRTSRLGAETFLTICDPEELATCPATATLTVARKAEPATPVAVVELSLVDPVEVSPANACQLGGNVVNLDGNDAMLDGNLSLVDAPFTFLPTGVKPPFWHATVTPPTGPAWTFDFNVAKLAGDLVVGKTYDRARRAESSLTDQVPHRPAMYIRRSDFDCATVTGSFTVVEYRVDFSTPDPGTKVATFAFEQHCEGDPLTAISGCIHYEAPFP